MEQGLNLYPHNTDVSIPFVSTLESIVIYMMRKLVYFVSILTIDSLFV